MQSEPSTGHPIHSQKSIRVTFIGKEVRIDDGRPRQEFLSLAVQELAEDGYILQGPQHSRFLVHNV